MAKNSKYKRQWLVGSRGNLLLIALLIFAFPVGLYLMWDESKWRTWVKTAVSVLWAAVLVIMVCLSSFPTYRKRLYPERYSRFAHLDPIWITS